MRMKISLKNISFSIETCLFNNNIITNTEICKSTIIIVNLIKKSTICFTINNTKYDTNKIYTKIDHMALSEKNTKCVLIRQ